jgi:hypothetical protein
MAPTVRVFGRDFCSHVWSRLLGSFLVWCAAIVYLAKCRTEGQLRAHADTMVVLKVLIHYKQQGSTSDLVSNVLSVPSHSDSFELICDTDSASL